MTSHNEQANRYDELSDEARDLIDQLINAVASADSSVGSMVSITATIDVIHEQSQFYSRRWA